MGIRGGDKWLRRDKGRRMREGGDKVRGIVSHLQLKLQQHKAFICVLRSTPCRVPKGRHCNTTFIVWPLFLSIETSGSTPLHAY